MSSISLLEILQENISVQIDGATTVVTTTESVTGVTAVAVLYNGQDLLEGAGDDYTITGANQITFTFTPEAASNMVVKITP